MSLRLRDKSGIKKDNTDMIEIYFKHAEASIANGSRHWMIYVQQEVVKKMKGSAKIISQDGNVMKLECSDTIAEFTIKTSTNSKAENILTLSLSSKKKDGSAAKAAPIPALVILLTIMYLMPNRERAGKLFPVTGKIGNQSYDNEKDVATVRGLFSALKNLCPDNWYLPYTEGVDDPETFFKKLKR